RERKGGEDANPKYAAGLRGYIKLGSEAPRIEGVRLARELAASLRRAARTMETSNRTESGTGECTRCRRQQPNVPDSPTRRRGADSGNSAWPPSDASQSLTPSPPPPLPCALRPPPLPGPRSAAIGSPASGLRSLQSAQCSPPRRSAGFWRPWDHSPGAKRKEEPHLAAEAMADGSGMTAALGKLSNYRHPVRLFWPKSKCYDYLYQEAEALLKNFPIQATISFYEDSDSEDEIEELI
ncbi:Protein ripply2, partial [Galemys pyrenaicus]